MRGKQGRKDSQTKRVNLDNARIGKVEQRIERDMHKPGCNDISWYTRNPELSRAASSLPFASILGLPVYSESVPGALVAEYTPNFGGDPYSLNALNQAATSMYSKIVHANSRNYNYTAEDLMVLTLAGYQVFAIIASATRIYGILKFYEEQNRYYPDTIVQQLGADPVDWRSNLGQIWFSLNNLIDRTRQIWVPKVMPVLDRWFWMNSMLYTDAEGPRAQTYAFNQGYYFIFDETGVSTGSALKTYQTISGQQFNPGINNQYTWADWEKAISALIDALLQSEDRGIIYGDILNCYGPEMLFALPQIPADYTVTPIYNAEVLTQFENMSTSPYRCTGLVQKATNTQNKLNGLAMKVSRESKAGLSGNSTPAGNKLVLNFHIPTQPSNDMVIIATRLMTFNVEKTRVASDSTNEDGQPVTRYFPTVAGTEIVNRVTMSYMVNGQPILGVVALNSVNGIGTNEMYLRLMAFDWHPALYEVGVAEGVPADGVPTSASPQNAVSDPLNAFLDYDNYTVVTPEEIRKLHEMALYSEFGVPHI